MFGAGSKFSNSLNPRETDKSPKLRIENLHYDVSERELESLFSQIGTIADGPSIKFDKSGRSEGVAWVTYTNSSDAERAKIEFDGAPAKGQFITVQFDFTGIRSFNATGESLAARLGVPTRGRGGKAFGDRPKKEYQPANESRGRGRGLGRGTGRGRGRGGRGDRGERKTRADLDAELERFMGPTNGKGNAGGDGDVQMAE